MCGIAITRLGISSEDFYNLTLIELNYALKEHYELEEQRQRFEYEKMRIQTFYLIQYLSMSETEISNPQDLMPFKWDIKDEHILLTEEDWIELEKQYCKKHLN